MGSSDDIPPWPDLIAEMVLLRQRVAEVDDLFPWTIPHPPATEEQLTAAEARLGHPLDPQHRAFLGYGNGWPDFHLGGSLLSTEELGQGPAWDEIDNNILNPYYEALPPEAGFIPPRDQIYPITFDEGSTSVFAIWKDGPVTDGGLPVLWFPWPESGDPHTDNFFGLFRDIHRQYEKMLQG
ncbi:SMI1/KNR4 family protein [Saccharopolyspora taberi]|uniref:Knr4/Smi1-like domain-containing protein n=1 Tax=Saccharopolyspora taberi TaxID=60895 RepID=A0ABN3VB24_9PSEU